MDIVYGDGTSPGGYKYCLFVTDLASCNTWVYGLRDLKGTTISDSIWLLVIDTGGFPKQITDVILTSALSKGRLLDYF